jgi:hypothetical protein
VKVSAPRPTRRKASGGVISFLRRFVSAEPRTKRAIAFIDAQNLFHAAKEAFGFRHPYSRALRYRSKTVRLPDGTEHSILVGQEKGIDIRLDLDYRPKERG